ncbi:autotransporter outer membrane beta-barrel domain-containing protein, partial [Salmonella enterica subsp. enterica]|nr:autotransporter outer membrane beta-barrel domain-containing protein [Salmonella enterica subsp. enterica serovar Litchfield]
MRNSPDRTPSLRPLARSLLLALATAPMAAAFAGDLDNQQAEVTEGDPVEAWTLKNGSKLTLRDGAASYGIDATDSTIELEQATVNRGPAEPAPVGVRLDGSSTLTANTSVFNTGLSITEHASATIRNSQIIVRWGAAIQPGDGGSWGVDLSNAFGYASDDARAYIDNTLIDVDEVSGAPILNNGHGVRLMQGQAEIRNGSSIRADNAGVLLSAVSGVNRPIAVRIDDSVVQSGNHAAVWVMPGGYEADYEITVANGAQLAGGNGNLLDVRTATGAMSARADVTFNVDDARLAGNVNFEPTSVTGSLDVFLRNKAQIDGRFINVTSAIIDSDSTWLMTGDSTVGHLALGNTGTVALGNGSTFNTLTVDTFDGAGGTLLFNTQLGDDSSATDRLIIKGDANGQANVRVLNAGGAGAKTDKGIELIRVGGASNAQFDLQGRAVGGQYEYFLFKDATNGGWYL